MGDDLGGKAMAAIEWVTVCYEPHSVKLTTPFGAIAHFERRLISERTKDGIAAARTKGKLPGRQPLNMKRVEAAIKLSEAKTSPTEAARQLGLGRSTVYREMRRLGIQRPA